MFHNSFIIIQILIFINGLECTKNNIKLYLNISLESKNSIFGYIYMKNENLNKNLTIIYKRFTNNENNRLCELLNYDFIHSIGIPCKIQTTLFVYIKKKNDRFIFHYSTGKKNSKYPGFCIKCFKKTGKCNFNI